MGLDGLLHRIPHAVVEDDEEDGDAVGPGDEVRGGGRTEDIGAVADAADDGLVRGGELGAERRPEPPAQAPGRGGAEVAPRLRERGLARVEVVLVDEDGAVIHEVADAPRQPGHVDRHVGCHGARAGGPRLAQAAVLALPAPPPLRDSALVRER